MQTFNRITHQYLISSSGHLFLYTFNASFIGHMFFKTFIPQYPIFMLTDPGMCNENNLFLSLVWYLLFVNSWCLELLRPRFLFASEMSRGLWTCGDLAIVIFPFWGLNLFCIWEDVPLHALLLTFPIYSKQICLQSVNCSVCLWRLCFHPHYFFC